MGSEVGTDIFSWFPFRWVPNTKQAQHTIEKKDGYWLAVIEFDDQGWFQDVRQRDALEEFLRVKIRENEDLLILVFIHGWKHNAKEDDDFLECFHGLLRDTCRSERHRRDRQILGVYLSWRGLSLSGPWSNLSFWARKKAATKVALGCVREILAWLRAFQVARNQPNNVVDGTRLIVVGHSFGGLILFTAVSEYLIESVIRCICNGERVVQPFGDLIILINPAFEAARYLPLYSAARKAPYPKNQRPCLLAVTSTNDDATKYWFPMGRWFSTRLESVRRNALVWDDDRDTRPPADAQERSILNTVGHLPWLTTHQLSCPNKDESAHQAYKGMGREPEWEKERQAFEEFNQRFRPAGHLKECWTRTYSSGATLKHVRGHPDNPFWTIEAAPEVVDGHSGIFGKVFWDFLRQVFDDRLQPIA
jgi:pimeloyl-ACP methyl ester carboxylesterase